MITYNLEKIKSINNNVIEKFEKHKRQAIDFQHTLANILTGEKRQRVLDCGNILEFKKYKDPKQTTKLNYANFCKCKLCPMCGWRSHLKIIEQVNWAVAQVDPKQLYHLVLTVKNQKTLTKQFLIKFKKLAVEFLRTYLECKDYIMSLEITISESGEFHPHLHILIKIENLPAKRNIRQIWGKFVGQKWAMTHIDPIKENTTSELTKYILKFENKEKMNNEQTLKVLLEATKGIRRYSTAGIFKKLILEANKVLNVEHREKEQKLLEYGQPELLYLRWFNGEYIEEMKSDLSYLFDKTHQQMII